MKIQNVADDAFRRYGKVLEGYDFTELLKEMKHTPVPEDVTYVPSVEEMEALPVAKELQNKGYGGLRLQKNCRTKDMAVCRSKSDIATDITRN